MRRRYRGISRYGTSYTEEQINEALNSGPLSSSLCVITIGHGTFMAMVAAGNEVPASISQVPPPNRVAVGKTETDKNISGIFIWFLKMHAYQENDIMGIDIFFLLARKYSLPLPILLVSVQYRKPWQRLFIYAELSQSFQQQLRLISRHGGQGQQAVLATIILATLPCRMSDMGKLSCG